MKIAVIGGGSTYTPELVNGFLARADRLALRELWLMDIDPARLAVVGGFAQRMATAAGAPFRVVLTDDRRAAIVDVAIPLLREHGPGLTTRQVAEAAGIAEGTLFRAFGSKDELVQACATAVLDPAAAVA